MVKPTLFTKDGGREKFPPFNFEGLRTYDLNSRPSKVFQSDLGHPVDENVSFRDWLESLPQQLAGNEVRRVCSHLARAVDQEKTIVAALGGHVIKTGCAPYLIDWIQKGILTAVTMNGAAAIHDVELALAGKTSEDVGAHLPEGKFGMARDTADAFAVAARAGAEEQIGLGWGLGKFLVEQNCAHADCSLLVAAYRAGIPCTVHVAMGTDIVHMHPHVDGGALGLSSMLDFKRLCSVVASMQEGVWLNLGSAVVLPEVFVKAVSVARNFGYNLDGLITVNLDKQAQYRSRVNVLERPSAEGIELIGHHEILIPLVHTALACEMASSKSSNKPSNRGSQAA